MLQRTLVGVVVTALAFAPLARAGATVTAQEELKWTAAAVPGVSTAALQGDMTQGASRFFLKYGAGLATPVHHHSADHSVVVVSGTLLLTVDGKERRLGPGSYFEFTGKPKHAAKCEGTTDCVMFVDARGAWDVVPEQPAKP